MAFAAKQITTRILFLGSNRVDQSKLISILLNKNVSVLPLPQILQESTACFTTYYNCPNYAFTDSIGFENNRLDKEKILSMLKTIMKKSMIGYNKIYLCFKYEDNSNDIRNYIEPLISTFGENILKYCTIIFTHCYDQTMVKEKYIKLNEHDAYIIKIINAVQNVIFAETITENEMENNLMNRRQHLLNNLNRDIKNSNKNYYLPKPEGFIQWLYAIYNMLELGHTSPVKLCLKEIQKLSCTVTDLMMNQSFINYYGECGICKCDMWNTDSIFTKCHHIFHEVCLNQWLNGPGYGWDDLRFMDMDPVFDVSNLNKSDIYQSCVEVIPFYEKEMELGTTVIDMFDSHTDDYFRNFMINIGVPFDMMKVSGLFSAASQTVRKEQAHKQSILIRNQIDYLLVDVILKSSCPLNSQLKKDILAISKYQTTKQFEKATYEAQLFIKKYGTHFTNRLHLGGSIIEEDFIQKSDYEKSDVTKSSYHAAAKLSFFQTFGLSARFTPTLVNTDTEKFQKSITRKLVHSKGGNIMLANGTLESWEKSIETRPAIVRRSIDNITFAITSENIPELSEFDLTCVRKEINGAIKTYIQKNIIRGCTNRSSPSFDWTAIVDDGSCAPAERETKFGGFIQTCEEDDGLVRKCDQYRQKNFYTEQEECPFGFEQFLLHQINQTENKFKKQCTRCGFLKLLQCCEDVAVGLGQRTLALYACYNEMQHLSRDSVNKKLFDNDESYIYGGSFTSRKFNPVTDAYHCPSDDFQKVHVLDDVQLCLAEKVQNKNLLNLPRFGGMFSCDEGNAIISPDKKECLPNYTAYVMDTIEGNCLLYVCLDFEKFLDKRQFPSIVLPPFVSIDIINMADVASSQNKSLLSKANHMVLVLTINALFVGLVWIDVIILKRRLQQQTQNPHHYESLGQ
ncbi:unnamed protein product [Adineta steineri]|uniref:MACPF domain-containing protein n=1 Tax=Adineta steineri TaxID=433720 RepID=A0A813WUQ1_9BILA|nr:unnamed protein product [Adineta steineri]CAF3689208.1 unnamed protein product [Adineta steineri]